MIRLYLICNKTFIAIHSLQAVVDQSFSLVYPQIHPWSCLQLRQSQETLTIEALNTPVRHWLVLQKKLKKKKKVIRVKTLKCSSILVCVCKLALSSFSTGNSSIGYVLLYFLRQLKKLFLVPARTTVNSNFRNSAILTYQRHVTYLKVARLTIVYYLPVFNVNFHVHFFCCIL